jgi:hypothetical protein
VSRKFKAYPSGFTGNRPHRSILEKGEVATYSVDWNGVINELSTSASSSAWSTDQSSVISTASAALASGVATIVVTASEAGTAILSDQLTMADGSKREQKFAIRVVDTR